MRNISSASFNLDARIARKMKHEGEGEGEREQKSEETRRIESRKKIPIEAGKISKRGATSVPVELSSRGLESFPDARIRSAIPLPLEYPVPLRLSPPTHPTPQRGTRQKFSTLHPRSFPEAAHLCPNTDLSPPSINSLGKHVTRGRLHPDTARKLPKVQRIPGTRQDCPFPPLTFRSAPAFAPLFRGKTERRELVNRRKWSMGISRFR